MTLLKNDFPPSPADRDTGAGSTPPDVSAAVPAIADKIPGPFPAGGRSTVPALCAMLVLSVVLVYCQTGRHDFVNYDDDRYVYRNYHVKQGLTLRSLAYYVVHRHCYTYHPVTTWSHLLDYQFFRLDAGKHHWMNVLYHAATAMGLFLVLRQMTRRMWSAAMAATVFAIHPLRVESVAWISERKDILGGLFFVLTLWAYVRYIRRPAAKGSYVVVWVLFPMGLLAKPMLVTLPLVLLLLDYWPLGSRQSLRHLVVEKTPLFLMSASACVITLHAQYSGGAVQPLEMVSWTARFANTPIAYANYVGGFFWPRGLTVLYPHPLEGFSTRDAIAKTVCLAVASLVALLLRRSMPYLLVGWLWFLGMLVPVIGLLQVGGQSMADRYTYLPQIGLTIAAVWSTSDAARWLANRAGQISNLRRSRALRHDESVDSVGRNSEGVAEEPTAPEVLPSIVRAVLFLTAAGILAALTVAAWQQCGYWRDSEALWKRNLSFPQYENLVAHYNLGLALAEKGAIAKRRSNT